MQFQLELFMKYGFIKTCYYLLNYRNAFGYYIYNALKRKMNKKKCRKKIGTLRGNYIFWRPLETIEREMLCKKDELLRKDIMYLKNYKKYFSII